MKEYVYYSIYSDSLFVWHQAYDRLICKENYVYLGELSMDEEEYKKEMCFHQIKAALEKIEQERQVILRCLSYLKDGV